VNRIDDPVFERVRAADPARHFDAAAASATPHARRVLQLILQTATSSQPEPPRRYPRRGLVAGLATAVLMIASVAVAAGMFAPDPADVETILEEYEGAASVHLPGWRPGLLTESVWCMYGPSEGAATQASEYSLDKPLTVELLINECAAGNDAARNQGSTAETFTLCQATMSEGSYRERFAGTGETVLAGDLEGPRPGFPVVLAWEADCATTRLGTSFEVELESLTSLDYVNRARETEIRLKAISLERCLTRQEAHEMAQAARRELGDEWLLVNEPLDGTPDCYKVLLDLEWGLVAVWGR
jgi:hypothetical protein